MHMPDEALPTSTPKETVTPKPKRRVLRRVVWLAVIGLALAGGARWYATHKTAAHDTSAKTADAAVPVDVATAARRDFPVFLNGLGVVQAWNTVTIRVRVDGQIEKVAFKEGQMVKQGDLLVQIDPRPFQAALDQAIAKKAQDEAAARQRQARPRALQQGWHARRHPAAARHAGRAGRTA